MPKRRSKLKTVLILAMIVLAIVGALSIVDYMFYPGTWLMILASLVSFEQMIVAGIMANPMLALAIGIGATVAVVIIVWKAGRKIENSILRRNAQIIQSTQPRINVIERPATTGTAMTEEEKQQLLQQQAQVGA
jgi:hypothetical protein